MREPCAFYGLTLNVAFPVAGIMSQDEDCESQEHNNGNADQGPHGGQGLQRSARSLNESCPAVNRPDRCGQPDPPHSGQQVYFRGLANLFKPTY
jgi:hypothetical protein